MARTLEFNLVVNDQASAVFGRLLSLIQEKTAKLQESLAAVSEGFGDQKINDLAAGFNLLTQRIQQAGESIKALEQQISQLQSVKLPQIEIPATGQTQPVGSTTQAVQSVQPQVAAETFASVADDIQAFRAELRKTIDQALAPPIAPRQQANTPAQVVTPQAIQIEAPQVEFREPVEATQQAAGDSGLKVVIDSITTKFKGFLDFLSSTSLGTPQASQPQTVNAPALEVKTEQPDAIKIEAPQVEFTRPVTTPQPEVGDVQPLDTAAITEEVGPDQTAIDSLGQKLRDFFGLISSFIAPDATVSTESAPSPEAPNTSEFQQAVDQATDVLQRLDTTLEGLPTELEIPTIDVPELQVGEIVAPEITAPEITIPEVVTDGVDVQIDELSASLKLLEDRITSIAQVKVEAPQSVEIEAPTLQVDQIDAPDIEPIDTDEIDTEIGDLAARFKLLKEQLDALVATKVTATTPDAQATPVEVVPSPQGNQPDSEPVEPEIKTDVLDDQILGLVDRFQALGATLDQLSGEPAGTTPDAPQGIAQPQADEPAPDLQASGDELKAAVDAASTTLQNFADQTPDDNGQPTAIQQPTTQKPPAQPAAWDGAGQPPEQQQADLLRTIYALKQQIVSIGANAGDSEEVIALKQQQQLLQESYRYKQQMAAIDGAGFTGEDLAIAKEVAAEVNRINQIKIQAQSEGDGKGSEDTQKEVARLQESIRYKQELASIKVSGFSDEDVNKAREFAAQINQLNVERINDEFAETTSLLKVINSLQGDIAGYQDTAGQDDEIVKLRQEQQYLEEALRYKQQMADIEGAGLSQEDLATAKEYATEVNEINNLLIKAQAEKGGKGNETTQRQVALLQESLRYKQELASIQTAGFSDEDVARATEVAAKINSINVEKIQNAGKGLDLGNIKGQFDNMARGIADSINGLGQLSAGFLAVQFAAVQVFSSISGFFQGLMDQAIRYRERLLSIQSTLASTNQVSIGGVAVEGAVDQINALQAPVENAFKELQKRSLKLAGITSDQLNDVFSTVANNISAVNGSLNDAVDLSVKFAAGMTTLGIPLHQQAQEISSILTGQITQDSLLAKKLNVDKQQLEIYRAQGKAVEYIQSKLEATEQGQSILAGMWSGVTSNIQEVFEVIQLQVGQQLLDPILEGMSGFLAFLDGNQSQITEWATLVATGFSQFGLTVFNVLQALYPTLEALGKAAVKLFSSLVEGGGTAFTLMAESLARLITLLGIVLVPIQMLADLIGNVASSAVGKLTITLVTMSVVIQGALIPSFNSLIASLSAMLVRMIAVATTGATAMIKALVQMALTTNTQLAPAIAKLAVALATQLGGAFTSLAAVMGGQVATALATSGASLTTLAASSVSATAGVAGSATAASIASGAFSALATSIAAAAGPLLLIGVALAAVSGAYIMVKRDAETAQQGLTSATNATISVEGRYIAQFKELQEIRKKGGTLTEEQARKERELARQMGASQGNVASQIKNLKEQINSPWYGGNKEELKKQVADLEKLNEEYGKLTRLDPKPAMRLGETNKLLQDDIKNVTAAIDSQATSQQQLEAAYEKLEKAAPQAIEAGLMSEKEAQALYAKGAEDERLQVEKRLEFRQLLQKSIEAEGKEQADVFTARQKDIETAIQTGQVSAVEGANKVAEAQTQAANARIAAIQRLLSEGQVTPESPEGRKLLREMKGLENEKTKIATDAAKKRADAYKQESELKVQELDLKKSGIELDVAKGVKDEERAALEITKIQLEQAQLRIEAVRKARKEANPNSPEGKKLALEDRKLQQEITKIQVDAYDKRAEALEKKQKEALDKLVQEELDAQVKLTELKNAGDISAEEFESGRADAAGKRIQKELQLEQEKLSKLKSMQAETPQEEERLAERIRASRKQTSQLTLQLLENEKAQTNARIAIFEKALNREVQLIQNVGNARKNLQEAINAELERQNRLIAAQQELQEAIGAEQKSRFAILKDATKNEAEKKKLAEIEAEFELRAGLQKLEIEKQVFQIKREQAKISREQAMLDQQASEAKAKAELAVARSKPESTPEQIAALELALQAEQLKSENLKKSATLDQSLAVFEDQAFNTKQRAEKNQLELARANASANEGEKNQRLGELKKRVNQEFLREGVDVSKLNPSLADQKSGQSGNFNALFGGLSGINALAAKSPVGQPQALPSFDETNTLLSGIQEKLDGIAKQGAQVTINNRIEKNTSPDEVNKQVFGALNKVFSKASK